MSRAKLYKYIEFIAFALCFAGIPLAMVITGYYYTWIQNRSIFEKNLFIQDLNHLLINKSFGISYLIIGLIKRQEGEKIRRKR